MTQNRGIPTVYNGRQYRSRLEARWALFFDLLGWRFEYEPFDLEGWIPDFLLLDANVLVEVKPAQRMPQEVVAEIDGCKGADGYEVMIAGCTVPVPTHPVIDCSDGVAIGWFRAEPMSWNGDMSRTWGEAVVQTFNEDAPEFYTDPDGKLQCTIGQREWGIGLFSSRDHLLHADPGYVPTIDKLFTFAANRFHVGSHLVAWGVYVPSVEIDPTGRMSREVNLVGDLWARAGNLTQWRGKQSVVTS